MVKLLSLMNGVCYCGFSVLRAETKTPISGLFQMGNEHLFVIPKLLATVAHVSKRNLNNALMQF